MMHPINRMRNSALVSLIYFISLFLYDCIIIARMDPDDQDEMVDLLWVSMQIKAEIKKPNCLFCLFIRLDNKSRQN